MTLNGTVVSSIQNTTLYTYRELRIATENFTPANKIGEGGKSQRWDCGCHKVLSADSRQGLREFLTEIKLIADIEHDNLVKLYGCCAEENHRILVYGYLENNSLAQTLLGGSHSSIQFSWPTRRKICIGVAQGLAFLHEEVQPHIVHRDIKASNILLDRDLMPKISDFGLAKLFPAHMTHISTRVAGTAGYLAPEYAIRGQLTRKADIYSFGFYSWRLFCGRATRTGGYPQKSNIFLKGDFYKCIFADIKCESRESVFLMALNLEVWQMHVKGELVSLVDTSLNEDYDAEEACRYLKIGLLCTQNMPKLRPTMSTVVKMLRGEIDVNDDKISTPGLLSEFMGVRSDKDHKDKAKVKNSSYTDSAGSSKLEISSSSSAMATSHATMTFNSIYDRSN
ncbi:hypothetical protein GH714_039658 [Hevea brasiliensis]|uniref:Protein kinase domain-containing protein n=1 Tax=Hevea brasiliensis TaxID=3981 RepID=A0A6A6KGY6_HEVBR|nr:hypothetical protein GH714_039658 [Hevea brasiliensis]